MDAELKKILEENLEVSRQSLKLLKKMRKEMWLNRIFTAIKWLAILGVLAWLYSQAQPVIEQAINVFGGLQGMLETLNQFQGQIRNQ